jgi:tetratricopeptide (TPR) repeat protein
VQDAAALFQQAIKQDSLFAPAYSGLSMALSLMPWFHHQPSAEVHDGIVAAARRALALDPTLALPHVALGMAHWEAYNWKGAETEFDTAVRLEPRNVEARVQYGRLLLGLGRLSEAFEQLRAARREDPASALVLSWTTIAYSVAGQVDSALVESRRALETDSTNFTTLGAAAAVYLATNRLEDLHAVAVLLPDGNLSRGYYLAMSGDTAGARELLRRLDARPRVWGDQTQRALTYLGLGDSAGALAALEHATDARELWPIYPSVADRMFDPIRRSARFRELVERAGLGEYIPALTR